MAIPVLLSLKDWEWILKHSFQALTQRKQSPIWTPSSSLDKTGRNFLSKKNKRFVCTPHARPCKSPSHRMRSMRHAKGTCVQTCSRVLCEWGVNINSSAEGKTLFLSLALCAHPQIQSWILRHGWTWHLDPDAVWTVGSRSWQECRWTSDLWSENNKSETKDFVCFPTHTMWMWDVRLVFEFQHSLNRAKNSFPEAPCVGHQKHHFRFVICFIFQKTSNPSSVQSACGTYGFLLSKNNCSVAYCFPNKQL